MRALDADQLDQFACKGHVRTGFEQVAEEFQANLAARGDAGAAFCAMRGREVLVDLWGGKADVSDQREWSSNTLQVIFSGTKGLVALCVLLLADDGMLDVDATVSSYWPEFGTGGKRAVTVRDVLTHLAGVPGFRGSVSPAELVDDRHMADRVAKEPRFWDERSPAYHALTFGWICGELVRRCTGSSVGQLLAQRIATPRQLETWIGLPAAQGGRLSRVVLDAGFTDQLAALPATARCSLFNPPLFSEPLLWNKSEFQRREVPGINGVGTARSLAKLYSSLVADHGRDPSVPLSRDLLAEATALQMRGRDACTGEDLAYGLGFQVQTELAYFGPATVGFGHTGAGGSVHGAWPDYEIGFSYVMNCLRNEGDDLRARRLLGALYACL